MKKIDYLLFGLLLSFTSCKENEPLFFDPNDTALQIWFGTSSSIQDSLTYNYAYSLTEVDSIIFNARLTGYPLDRDITFELEAVEGDIQAVDYHFPKYVLKAGQVELRSAIYIDRPKREDLFKETPGHITFKLKSTTDLLGGSKEMSSLKVSLRNNISKPDNWDSAPLYYRPLNYYFGSYSDVKYKFIMQVMGLTYFTIYVISNSATEADPYGISTSEMANYIKECKIALEVHNQENGALLDENNLPVVFP
ncbi:DUF4843 domain-containing protein [Sphingobacterium tabacisoli]|uniref:DUF4843 domain-containing protein n=1 Tax=Sphingobacterium tabacisoli TaxID=2044855 RepID=A0ABW5L8U0_9SPHI|nr:DUF4843 domain-containing protein [Sphingobacterium tabacisoli]